MYIFNAIYTLTGCRTTQPIQEKGAKASIELDSQCLSKKWMKWVVSLPLRFVHGAMNEISKKYYKNIGTVVNSQIYSGNSINAMQFLFNNNGHILSSKKAINVLASHYRDDPDGYFETEDNHVFINSLKELYPQMNVDRDVLLLTCSKGHVKHYRNCLENYIKGDALEKLKPLIFRVADEVIDSIDETKVSAQELTETYTVAVLARLFLDLKGNISDFQKIGEAISLAIDYQFLKKWGSPDADQKKDYEDALEIIRSAIRDSSGEFVESLKGENLSEIQINAMLMLTYFAGSETTSSALQYMLWSLGQKPDLQEQIRNDLSTLNDGSGPLDNFINACFKEYTSVPFISRIAKKDIVIKVNYDNGKVWEYPVAKGESLMAAPLLGGTSIFGIKPQSCPGQWLAKAEIRRLILALLNRYEIESLPKKDKLETIPGFGFLKVEPVDLILRKVDQ